MFLIVGLGNPGKKYENTYHNVGFKAIDAYANSKGVALKKKKGNAVIFEGKINNQKVILAKPQTFMNLSGTSVQSLSKKFKVDASKIIIIYDDIDLCSGSVRFRNEGSAGTHNGMKNVVSCLNTNKVPRIRIGVGQDFKGKKNLADYVLSTIKKQEQDNINQAIKSSMLIIDEFVNNDGELENKSIN